MKILSYILLLFFVLISVSALKAQERVNLQQAIESGIKNNPMLKMSGAKVKIAEAKLEEMKEQRLPNANASLAYSHFNLYTPLELKFGGSSKPLLVIPASGFDATIGTGAVQEEIFAGFRVQSQIKSAELLLEASKLDGDKDKVNLCYAITSAYYNIYKIMKTQEIVDENLKPLEEKIRELNSLEKQGAALHNDVLKVQMQKTNLEFSKKELESTRQTALYNFKLMIGLPENNVVEIDTNNLLIGRELAGIADLQNQALSNRAELKTNSLQLKAADYNIKALKSAYYPSLGVQYSYYYINPSNNIIPDKSAFINAGGPGLSLSYSLSALWKGQGKLEEYKANILQIGSANEIQINAIKSEVFSNYSTWVLAKEKINVAQKSIEEANENYRTTDSRYKNNISTMTELMDANLMLLQAKLNKINAMTDAQLGYFKLINSTGK